MLNLNAVSGVKSTPLSKNILENSIGSNSIKDSRAFANYEFLMNSLTSSNFNAPSVLLASGDGSFYPKTASYQNDFYSSQILGRNGFMNIWQASYLKTEDYSVTYYDGYSLFKRFTIQHDTGKALLKSLELRNGNTAKESGISQIVLGHNLTPGVDEVGLYRHSIRTRHDATNQGENAIDFFAWDPTRDTKGALGSRRVASLNGAGNLEILNGCQIDGGISLSIETPSETQIETNSLAVLGKGVMYYNSNKKRYRYSENGEPFKYFGGGGSGGLESCSFRTTAPYRLLDPQEAFGVRMYNVDEITIKEIRFHTESFNSGYVFVGLAIYKMTYMPDGGESGYSRLFKFEGSVAVSRYGSTMASIPVSSVAIEANSDYIVVFYNYTQSQNGTPTLSVSINQAASLYNGTSRVPEFTLTNFTVPSTGLFIEYTNNTAIVPYFQVVVE